MVYDLQPYFTYFSEEARKGLMQRISEEIGKIDQSSTEQQLRYFRSKITYFKLQKMLLRTLDEEEVL